jgi:class 3 adenylate cyclase
MANHDHISDLARLFGDDEARWTATLGRDVRADGLFYYAVKTTGIFCRPICPARKPKRENVIFVLRQDEAEAAGYRACKTCRPNLATQMMATDACNVRPAAILFADVVGSSAMARRIPPQQMLDVLGNFHDWSGRMVRKHDGRVHKNLGDGFMAVFGDDESRAADALHAVRCGVGLMDQAIQKAAAAGPRMEVGIGVHYGLVAFGDSGGTRALLGETVNVASRLENATRRLGSPLVVSDEIMRAIQRPHPETISDRFKEIGNIRLPGCKPQRVWAARESNRRSSSPAQLAAL